MKKVMYSIFYFIFGVSLCFFIGCSGNPGDKPLPITSPTAPGASLSKSPSQINNAKTKSEPISSVYRDLTYLVMALKLYQLHLGQYPDNSLGLEALRTAPTSSPAKEKWQGPYVSDETPLPRDIWGNNYYYEKLAADAEIPFDLRSLGPDGVKSDDDIVANEIPDIKEIISLNIQ